jgi:hypothetical protein
MKKLYRRLMGRGGRCCARRAAASAKRKLEGGERERVLEQTRARVLRGIIRTSC